MELMEKKHSDHGDLYAREPTFSTPLPQHSLPNHFDTRPQLKGKNWDGGFSTWEAKISNCEQD